MSKSKSKKNTGKMAGGKPAAGSSAAGKGQPASKKSQAKSASKPPTIWLIVAAVAAVAIIALIAFLPRNNPAAASLPKEISVAQAKEKYDSGAFVLDVRQPEEWNDYHVPGTTLIPLGELPNRLNEVPKDKEVVVVCRSGNRSQQGRDILLNAGFTQVTSMAGGVSSWRDAGYPTVSGP